MSIYLKAVGPPNPLGGRHLRPSALSFVGDDHPDRRPPHSALSGPNCLPRDPRDTYHGLLAHSQELLLLMLGRGSKMPLVVFVACAHKRPKQGMWLKRLRLELGVELAAEIPRVIR